MLHELVKRELAAGNEILEMSGGFPAPPAGDCLTLARRVTTRAHSSGDGLRFRERDSSVRSGEFTDERGFFFILEPPGPPPAEPDMDAIRAPSSLALVPAMTPLERAEEPASVVERFRASMVIDYEKWHDGVEALAALAAPATLATPAQRIATLVAALEGAELYAGLGQALDQVADFHPPQIVAALLRGLLARDGATAVQFAAMLMFIHGKAPTSFDWDQRPFFPRSHTNDSVERAAACRELRATIGVDQ